MINVQFQFLGDVKTHIPCLDLTLEFVDAVDVGLDRMRKAVSYVMTQFVKQPKNSGLFPNTSTNTDISAPYVGTWLTVECDRQTQRLGVADNNGLRPPFHRFAASIWGL